MAGFQSWRDISSLDLGAVTKMSFYGKSVASSRSKSRQRVRPKSVHLTGGVGAPIRPHKPPASRRRALENVETVEAYEPGMLLQERPPVTFSQSDDDSLSPDSDIGDYGDFYHAETMSTPSNTGQKRNDTSLRTLLQEQQSLLRTIITKQEALEAKQTTFEQKLSVLEEKMITQSTASPSSSDSSPHGSRKRKRLVSRELSVSKYVRTYIYDKEGNV